MNLSHLLSIEKHQDKGFKTITFFEDWQIAVLNHCEKVDFDNLCQVERHNLTNEAFILTEGRAYLILAEDGDSPGETHLIHMEKNTSYNILQNKWHHVVMSTDAKIFIIEKSNTARENSDYETLTAAVIEKLKAGIRF